MEVLLMEVLLKRWIWSGQWFDNDHTVLSDYFQSVGSPVPDLFIP
jgi:hypothetical protein